MNPDELVTKSVPMTRRMVSRVDDVANAQKRPFADMVRRLLAEVLDIPEERIKPWENK